MDIFRTSFSSGSHAKVPPLRIYLVPDAKPIKISLRSYSQDQNNFMDEFVTDLVQLGLSYANPSSQWACAPLLVPKPGSRYRFTVDLRPVNKFTVRHQCQMSNLEHELIELGKLNLFATFDLSHGYWQLPFPRGHRGFILSSNRTGFSLRHASSMGRPTR